jgi:hypothetical protein
MQRKMRKNYYGNFKKIVSGKLQIFLQREALACSTPVVDGCRIMDGTSHHCQGSANIRLQRGTSSIACMVATIRQPVFK